MYTLINDELARQAEEVQPFPNIDETIAKIFSEHKREGT